MYLKKITYLFLNGIYLLMHRILSDSSLARSRSRYRKGNHLVGSTIGTLGLYYKLYKCLFNFALFDIGPL